MWMHCDNYATCNESVIARNTQDETDTYARAKGWHIWRGNTIGGTHTEAVLGPRCAGRHTREKLPPLLPGEESLFQMEVIVDESSA